MVGGNMLLSDLMFMGVFGLLSFVVCFVLFALSFYIGSVQYLGRVLDKVLAFECGFMAFKDSSSKFNISFYLLGILFLMFDLEIMHLLPWILTVWYNRGFSFIGVLCFMFLLTLGFIYEWSTGALSLAFVGS